MTRMQTLKALTLAPHVENKKATYAVTCNTLKYLAVLMRAIDACALLEQARPLFSGFALRTLITHCTHRVLAIIFFHWRAACYPWCTCDTLNVRCDIRRAVLASQSALLLQTVARMLLYDAAADIALSA